LLEQGFIEGFGSHDGAGLWLTSAQSGLCGKKTQSMLLEGGLRFC
jgi:hypothetical protein